MTCTRTAATAVTAVLTGLAVVLSAAPAQAVPGHHRAAAIAVRDSRLELTPPLATRPMDEQCGVGGVNHPYCGQAVLLLTLSGFAAYGGIPSCTDPQGCPDERPLATSAGGRAEVDVLVRCSGRWFPRVRSIPVVVQSGLGPSEVSSASRIDADTARLVFFLTLPSPSEIGACAPGDTLLAAEVVRGLSVDFAGTSAGVPSWTTRLPGVHRVPLPR